MKAGIYKAIGVGILICLLIIIFGVGIGLVTTSPRHSPDKWLKAEEKIVSFFNQITLPIKITRLSWLPADKEILMSVYGVRVREIQDSWLAPRPEGRVHEGQDVFADKGTPVFSGTKGYVIRMGAGELGGNFVYIAGTGGRRYYYAHLDKIADGLKRGQEVTIDTVLGFVGNTGNADGTPAHLHFGVYVLRKAVDPLPLLINR
ncbi:MAG: M23 family metallopeptidase [Candidatus Taylorbacteria bacterium]|nr:M23 family metallopeptidase [Candidatus Taylorbacteria bacterium]